jgi:hypothetical protein
MIVSQGALMAVHSQPRVAVLGMTESGRGWATLISGAGWPLAIYDPDAALLHSGEEDIVSRRRQSQGSGIPAVRDERSEPVGLSIRPAAISCTGSACWNRSSALRDWRR